MEKMKQLTYPSMIQRWETYCAIVSALSNQTSEISPFISSFLVENRHVSAEPNVLPEDRLYSAPAGSVIGQLNLNVLRPRWVWRSEFRYLVRFSTVEFVDEVEEGVGFAEKQQVASQAVSLHCNREKTKAEVREERLELGSKLMVDWTVEGGGEETWGEEGQERKGEEGKGKDKKGWEVKGKACKEKKETRGKEMGWVSWWTE